MMFFTGFPASLIGEWHTGQTRIFDGDYDGGAPLAYPIAQAAVKTKTIVFFAGSNISTTAVASAATTTFSFTISLPDLVPTSRPIRSAYISYNTWFNSLTLGPTATTFTLNKQGGSVQQLTAPKLTGTTTNEAMQSIRLDATAAMQNLVGNASNTYAMIFTANVTGPTRIGESAELYITYDYDPMAATQVNTVYQWAYSTSTQLGTTTFTSPAFNFNLPETNATTTFTAGTSSTNQFWIEYRGFIPGGTNITATVGWNSETTSTATFTQATEEFSYLLLSPPKTANTSPSAANTFKMISSAAKGIGAPSALAIATYSFNFGASAKLRKTIQVLLTQSSSTAATATINTQTSIAIPETSPSSTGAFVFGRTAFGTSSNPGINASMQTSTCSSFPATTPIAQGTASTRNAGYITALWNTNASSTVQTFGVWNICSTFTRSAITNIPGLTMFLSYDYTNTMAAGSGFNTNLSFLGASHLSATGTNTGIFASAGINASIADASATARFSWLDAEFDNNSAGTTGQSLTLGIGAATTSYAFPAQSSARRSGATFSATSSLGFSSNTTTTVQCSVACINDAAYNVLAQSDITPAKFDQIHFHWRSDNGSETAASSSANEDTATTTYVNIVNRLRIEMANDGDASSSAAFRLEYATSTGAVAWTQLATSTVGSAAWQMATSSFVTDGAATTDIATSTGGTTNATSSPVFSPGEVVASSSRNQSKSITLTGSQFSEIEYTLRATSNALITTYYFRLTNAGATTTYSVYPSVTVANIVPVVTAVSISANPIILLNYPTTTVSVNATISDNNGCADITGGTSTILLYRSGVTSSSCQSGSGNGVSTNLNCYVASAFTASSICSGNSINTTTTFGMYYFAQATDASSSFPTNTWKATVMFKGAGNATGTGDDSTNPLLQTLLAISISTTSFNYGSIAPGGNTGSTNQMTSVNNQGNSSATIQVAGQTLLASGAANLVVSSQHFSTSSFAYPGTSTALSASSTPFSLLILTAPTSTASSSYTQATFWGLAVPNGTTIGAYNGSNIFSGVFSQ